MLQGWALSEQGQPEEGIAKIREGTAAYRARGGEEFLSHDLALLAEAYGKAGQPEEGLMVLTETLDLVNKTGERFSEAELRRLEGLMTMQKEFDVRNSRREGADPQSLTPNPRAQAET
jgi:predicted ATPase